MFEVSAKIQIINKMKEAVTSGVSPTKLFVSKQVELEMCLLTRQEVGDSLFRDITRHGPRKAIEQQGGTLYGMKVHWDADALMVK